MSTFFLDCDSVDPMELKYISVERGSFRFKVCIFLHLGVSFLMIIETTSHLSVSGSSSSSNLQQFEAIPILKDFVRVADLQWCNVLSTNLIRSEIFCCWKSISKDCTRMIIFSIKYFEDLVIIKFILSSSYKKCS